MRKSVIMGNMAEVLNRKGQNSIEMKDSYLLAGLILSGWGVRLFMWSWTRASSLGDMIYYVDMARSLGEGHIMEAIGPLAPPLYPLLIYAGYQIVQDYEISACLVSMVFGGLLVYPVFRLSYMLYGRQAAIIAGSLVVFAWQLINFSVVGYAESTYLFFITMAVFKTAKAIRLESNRELLWSGLFFGLAFLTKGQAIVFFALTLFCVPMIQAIKVRKIGYHVIYGVFFLLIGYGIITSSYTYLLYEKTGKLMLNPKKESSSSGIFQYDLAENMKATYSLRKGRDGYWTFIDVINGGRRIDPGDLANVGRRIPLYDALRAYLQQVVDRLFKGLSDVAHRLFPYFFPLFVAGLLNRRWDIYIEGYLLGVIGSNIMSSALFWWNPRYLSTLMPLILVIGAYGIVRIASLLGNISSKFLNPNAKYLFWGGDKGWTILLTACLLLISMVSLLQKKPNYSYITKLEHQRRVADQLKQEFGTDMRIMSWGVGRSAIPHYMGIKQSQVRTIPMSSMEMALEYAKQEGVRLLVFDTEEIDPVRFPCIKELSDKKGEWPGLHLVIFSNRESSGRRHAILVYKVI